MKEEFTVSSPIWLIGCGNMAGAMLRRWLDAGLEPEAVTVVRPSGIAPASGVLTLTTMPKNEAPPSILMLGVKPQKLDEVAQAVAAVIGPETLLISILAGVELQALEDRFPQAGAIVRAMPNMPVAIGRGVVGLAGAAGARRAEVDALMAPLGTCLWIADEDLLHAVAALAASGPAFVFRFIAAMAAGAQARGLPAGQAMRLAVATVDGAAGLAVASSESADTLADRVASPGGMTRKGLDVLDEDNALRDLVARALTASEQRSREMAAEAR
jgi:pyrroline-5-carboxylate reductase